MITLFEMSRISRRVLLTLRGIRYAQVSYLTHFSIPIPGFSLLDLIRSCVVGAALRGRHPTLEKGVTRANGAATECRPYSRSFRLDASETRLLQISCTSEISL